MAVTAEEMGISVERGVDGTIDLSIPERHLPPRLKSMADALLRRMRVDAPRASTVLASVLEWVETQGYDAEKVLDAALVEADPGTTMTRLVDTRLAKTAERRSATKQKRRTERDEVDLAETIGKRNQADIGTTFSDEIGRMPYLVDEALVDQVRREIAAIVPGEAGDTNPGRGAEIVRKPLGKVLEVKDFLDHLAQQEAGSRDRASREVEPNLAIFVEETLTALRQAAARCGGYTDRLEGLERQFRHIRSYGVDRYGHDFPDRTERLLGMRRVFLDRLAAYVPDKEEHLDMVRSGYRGRNSA